MKRLFELGILLVCCLGALTASATPTSNDPNFSVSLLASGLLGPANAAVFRPATGDLVISEFSGNRVTLVNATTGATSVFVSQGAPDEIAVRSSDGLVAVKTHPDGPITFYSSTGVFQGSLPASTPSASITGLAFDASSNLFVANAAGTIYQFSGATPWLASSTIVVSGLNPLEGIAFSAGNLFAISYSAGTVYKISGATPTTITTVPSTKNPSGIAVDPITGDIYISEFSGTDVLKVPAGGESASTFATGFTNSLGLGFDTSGNLYVNEYNSGNVWKFTRQSSQSAVMTFPCSDTTNGCSNVSAIATFNCPSGLTPCPDPDAHSMKFTVGHVSSPGFSFVLTATEVTGDGVCESGIPDNPADPIDCRFVRFFGEPAFNPNSPPTSTKVPLCYPYSHNKCVFYRVIGAPPPPGQTGSPYSNGVQYKIAWNNVFAAPTGYVNSPRMFDDPSNDQDGVNYPHISDPSGNGNVFPYSTGQPEDNQFVFDVTTFFDPRPNTVGTDPTTGGTGKSFNDWAIAWPLTLAQIQQPINSDGSSVFSASRGVIPVKFTYVVDGAATCNLPPATISLTRLSGGTLGAIDESLFVMAADSGPNFRISGCQYMYNLAAKSLGPGTYVVTISINSKDVGSAFFALR